MPSNRSSDITLRCLITCQSLEIHECHFFRPCTPGHSHDHQSHWPQSLSPENPDSEYRVSGSCTRSHGPTPMPLRTSVRIAMLHPTHPFVPAQSGTCYTKWGTSLFLLLSSNTNGTFAQPSAGRTWANTCLHIPHGMGHRSHHSNFSHLATLE